MWPRVRFVDAPEVSAGVRFDFHDRLTETTRTSLLADDWSLGVPVLQGEADAESVQYGPRTLRFTLVVEGPKLAALAKQSAVAREMLRRDNWLLFQLNEDTEPVWFRLYRAEPGELSFEFFRNDREQDEWHIAMSLPAEAWAYGSRITIGPLSMVNDPTNANPNMVVLPDIVGDAPAPARIRFRYTAAQTGRRHLIATSPVPEAFEEPIWWQIGTGDSWSVGADTGSPSTDADYVGGTHRPVSFSGTPGMATRVSGTAPSAVPPGRYKVHARVGRSDASSTFAARFGVTTGFSYVYGDTLPLIWGTSAVEHMAYVDLGVFRLPQGNPLLDLSGEDDVTAVVSLQAQRLSGTGSLHLNGLLLIPVGDENARTLYVDYPGLAPSALLTDEFHDADLDVVYCRSATTGVLSSMNAPGLEGGFPVLVPGERNALHWLEQTSPSRAQVAGGGSDVPDRVTSAAQIVVSYHPRSLWMRGS